MSDENEAFASLRKNSGVLSRGRLVNYLRLEMGTGERE
jgi:hypothetical protein